MIGYCEDLKVIRHELLQKIYRSVSHLRKKLDRLDLNEKCLIFKSD